MNGPVTAPARPRRRRRGAEQAMVPDAEFTSYYGRPVIKEPVWQAPDVAGYLFFGGLAGASSVLAAAAHLSGHRELARAAKVSALGAISLSAAALIHDLGRPARFTNMLRVFKPSSPMSVGSWLLAGYGPVAGAAAVSEVTGILPAAGTAATLGAGLLGPAIATYTAALICDTAVPSWHAGYREMPYVFAGSAASAAGGLGLLATAPGAAEPARKLAVLGAGVELVAKRRLISRLAATPGQSLAEPYETGTDRRGAAARRGADRGRPGRRAARAAQPGAVRPVRRVAAGGLGADQVRHLRGGHGLGPGPEVHDRAPAAPALTHGGAPGGMNWRVPLLARMVVFHLAPPSAPFRSDVEILSLLLRSSASSAFPAGSAAG